MKHLGKILLISTAILAGSINYACPKIKDWAGESMKRLEQIEYKQLKKYTKGTKNIEINEGGNFWKYASEDIKKNPKLQKMIGNREIDIHSIIALYKEINHGYPIGGGIYKKPIWNFESSD